MTGQRKTDNWQYRWLPHIAQLLAVILALGIAWGRSEFRAEQQATHLQDLEQRKLDKQTFETYKTGRESAINQQLQDIKQVQAEIRNDIKQLLRRD